MLPEDTIDTNSRIQQPFIHKHSALNLKLLAWLETAQPNEPDKARIYIFQSQNGDLVRVIVRGGKYGLDEAHFQAVLKALKRIDEVDNGQFLSRTNKTSAKFIAARSSFMDFGSKEEDNRASANDFHDSIFINMKDQASVLKHEGDILVESYEVDAGRRSADILYMVDSISLNEIQALKNSFPDYFGDAAVVVPLHLTVET